jgi:hypothetical protein
MTADSHWELSGGRQRQPRLPASRLVAALTDDDRATGVHCNRPAAVAAVGRRQTKLFRSVVNASVRGTSHPTADSLGTLGTAALHLSLKEGETTGHWTHLLPLKYHAHTVPSLCKQQKTPVPEKTRRSEGYGREGFKGPATAPPGTATIARVGTNVHIRGYAVHTGAPRNRQER